MRWVFAVVSLGFSAVSVVLVPSVVHVFVAWCVVVLVAAGWRLRRADGGVS